MDGGKIDALSILVVDDDITCLAIVAAILKKFKYEVVTVKHPKDALCTLRIKGGTFDLVVSDVHMPDMNGFELQQAISQEFNLPVVLMSADDNEGVAMKGLESGAAFFIMKPVSPDDLRDLWQFAAMKRKNNSNNTNTNNNSGFLEEHCEENTSIEKYISDEIDVSASSVNEDSTKKKESKKKSPIKEGFDEKNGENSQSSSQKRPKIVWTNSLHNRFLEAIRSIGLERAVPKKILEVMNIPGLTRENVASHLQKYRIFLRRVSDASYKIQYSNSQKGLGRNFKLISPESSRIISPNSILVPDGFNYQHSQSIFGQSRLLSGRGSWQNPSIGTSTLISRQNAHDCVRHVQNNYGARSSIQGHLASISLEDHSNAMSATRDAFPGATNYDATSKENIGRSNVTSALSLKNLMTYQTNYVGYSMPNIKNFVESRQSGKYEGLRSSRGVTKFPSDDLESPSIVHAGAMATNGNINLGLLAHEHDEDPNSYVVNNVDQEQWCDVIADYRLQLPSTSSFENGGEIQESAITPIFDMSEFDILSAQQALEQGCLGNTTLPNQITIQQALEQDQAQQNNGGGNSSFYSDMVYWGNCVNVPYSFDQIPNLQLQSSQLTNSQGLTTTSLLNETAFQPTNEQQQQQQQMLEGVAMANSVELGTYAHLTKTVLSPTHERNDDDFLESLLAPFREDHAALEASI